jgi:arginase family enzyme
MEIALYLDPANPAQFNFKKSQDGSRIGDTIKVSAGKDDESLEEYDIAIVGVEEGRNTMNNSGCAMAAQQVRKHLYQLYRNSNDINIIDLGNIRQGDQVKDTYFALREVLTELQKANTLPIIIGGGHDLTYPIYLAYENLGKIINMVTIDAMFDLAKTEEKIHSRAYLSKIILHKPNFLFNYANIGYQTFFVDPDAIKLMNKLFFDIHRLGTVREHIEETEPVIRNADTISFDIGAIRHSDAPGNANSSPNGFTGEEACQMMRYAGLSDKVSSMGLFEVNPEYDPRGQTAHLAAQMIWYFLDGFGNRSNDFPDGKNGDYIKYYVELEGSKEGIIFYKSKVTDRWWMELPVSEEKRSKYRRHLMVPCSYLDYQTACNNEIPDRWWKAYQKLM